MSKNTEYKFDFQKQGPGLGDSDRHTRSIIMKRELGQRDNMT